MQNRPLRVIAAVPASAGNLFNPGTTTGGVNSPATNLYGVITHMRAVNKTSSPVTISLYIGATGGSAAGTEFAWVAKAIPANDAIDWNGRVPIQAADFLTGLASLVTSVVLEIDGEIGVAIA